MHLHCVNCGWPLLRKMTNSDKPPEILVDVTQQQLRRGERDEPEMSDLVPPSTQSCTDTMHFGPLTDAGRHSPPAGWGRRHCRAQPRSGQAVQGRVSLNNEPSNRDVLVSWPRLSSHGSHRPRRHGNPIPVHKADFQPPRLMRQKFDLSLTFSRPTLMSVSMSDLTSNPTALRTAKSHAVGIPFPNEVNRGNAIVIVRHHNMRSS